MNKNNSVDEIAAAMLRQSRRMEMRFAVRAVGAVCMISVWEIFRAFVVPMVAGSQMWAAHFEREEMRAEIAEVKELLVGALNGRDSAKVNLVEAFKACQVTAQTNGQDLRR